MGDSSRTKTFISHGGQHDDSNGLELGQPASSTSTEFNCDHPQGQDAPLAIRVTAEYTLHTDDNSFSHFIASSSLSMYLYSLCIMLWTFPTSWSCCFL